MKRDNIMMYLKKQNQYSDDRCFQCSILFNFYNNTNLQIFNHCANEIYDVVYHYIRILRRDGMTNGIKTEEQYAKAQKHCEIYLKGLLQIEKPKRLQKTWLFFMKSYLAPKIICYNESPNIKQCCKCPLYIDYRASELRKLEAKRIKNLKQTESDYQTFKNSYLAKRTLDDYQWNEITNKYKKAIARLSIEKSLEERKKEFDEKHSKYQEITWKRKFAQHQFCSQEKQNKTEYQKSITKDG